MNSTLRRKRPPRLSSRGAQQRTGAGKHEPRLGSAGRSAREHRAVEDLRALVVQAGVNLTQRRIGGSLLAQIDQDQRAVAKLEPLVLRRLNFLRKLELGSGQRDALLCRPQQRLHILDLGTDPIADQPGLGLQPGHLRLGRAEPPLGGAIGNRHIEKDAALQHRRGARRAAGPQILREGQADIHGRRQLVFRQVAINAQLLQLQAQALGLGAARQRSLDVGGEPLAGPGFQQPTGVSARGSGSGSSRGSRSAGTSQGSPRASRR